jgi:hypothetical protein
MCAHFVVLLIFLLANLALALCIVGKFGISIANMFGEFGVECVFQQV